MRAIDKKKLLRELKLHLDTVEGSLCCSPEDKGFNDGIAVVCWILIGKVLRGDFDVEE